MSCVLTYLKEHNRCQAHLPQPLLENPKDNSKRVGVELAVRQGLDCSILSLFNGHERINKWFKGYKTFFLPQSSNGKIVKMSTLNTSMLIHDFLNVVQA